MIAITLRRFSICQRRFIDVDECRCLSAVLLRRRYYARRDEPCRVMLLCADALRCLYIRVTALRYADVAATPITTHAMPSYACAP